MKRNHVIKLKPPADFHMLFATVVTIYAVEIRVTGTYTIEADGVLVGFNSEIIEVDGARVV